MRKPSRILWTVLALVLATGNFGCGDGLQEDEDAASDSTNISIHGGADGTTITIDGVQFHLAGNTRNQNIRNDEITFEDEDGRQYEIRAGELLLNGEPLGRFESGDVVRLNRDGSVTVNGQPHQP